MIDVSNSNVLSAAKIYIGMGWNPIPIVFQTKEPLKKYKWRDIKCTEENLRQCFTSEKSNIGISLGKSSGNLIDIDLDCPEAIALAPAFLPHTDCIFGRKTKPNSHYIYIVDSVTHTEKYGDPQIKGKGKMIVELRGEGGYTVFPPSIHENTGEIISFSSNGLPTFVETVLLRNAVLKLATAALLVRYWNQQGIRQDIALALSGILLKNDWSDEEASEFIYRIARAAGDEEAEKRADTVKYTRQRIDNKEAVYGFNKFKELLPEGVAKKVAEWLHLNVKTESSFQKTPTDEEVIDKLNKKHAVLMVDGKYRILNIPKPHEHYTLSEEKDFKGLYRNQKIILDKGVTPIAEYWLHHSLRRQYPGIKFYPGPQVGDFYNPWQGLKYQPIEGDCSLYIKHIYDNVAEGNKEIFDYIICWMASIIQMPHQKLEVALVLRGKEGTGKGVFAHEFGKLLGIHYSYIAQAKHLLGHFNAQLSDKVLVFADEAFYAGDKTSEGILKSIISEKKIMIEKKFYDPKQSSNYLNLIIASNNQWVVPAGMEARRFLVVDVSGAHMQDIEYFAAIKEQMRNGGREALVDYLLKVDIADFNHRNIPQTKALFENKLYSMTVVQKFWYDVLRQGKLLKSDANWKEEVDTNDLFNEVTEFSKNLGAKYRLSNVQVGTELKALCPSIKRNRRSHGTRDYYYTVPTLKECRTMFEAKIRMDIDWEDVCDDSDSLCDSFSAFDDSPLSLSNKFLDEALESVLIRNEYDEKRAYVSIAAFN